MAPLWILLTLLPILGAQRFNCKGRILGAYYADAKSGCKAFHVCVRVAGGGVRDFRFFCPPGTLFHQEAQTCTDWGDDDPLACPADIYDGQFDLYKIGSVYDTKKLSSSANHEEESEFGLQRAETGDRRLNQNSQSNNNAANDLRAAHSSDFFSGQRDRGRDEPSVPASAPTSPPAPPSRPAQSRQSFRRSTTPRPPPPTTQFTTSPTFPPAQPTSTSQYEISKRKLIRKRPVYHSTQAPSTFPQNNSPQQSFKEQQQNQQPFNEQFNQQSFREQNTRRPFKEQSQTQQAFKEQQILKDQSQQFQQQNFNRRPPQSQTRTIPTTTPDVPPQYKEYKEEYVEVSRVTPKPKPNRYYPNNPTPLPSSHATSAQYNKKDGLIELYNYDAQSTPGLNTQQSNNNNPFKVKNGYSVSDVFPREDFARTRSQNNNQNSAGRQPPTTAIDNTATRPTTQSYKNYNSVPYEPEKNNIIPFSKQNYYNSPTTTPSTTTFYTTVRSETPQNLNTVAYNTNIGFHSQSNFADPEEDDGQYRPPQGEDDGQYRPELYEKELLSGAHSLNIAASGNRLPEDQKSYSKTQAPPKYTAQTAAPRPFRPTPIQTTRAPEYTTTPAPQTQRIFDLFQTYTTTSRPTSEFPGSQDFVPINNSPQRPTTVAPRSPETKPQTTTDFKTKPRPQRPAQTPTSPPRPVHNKEDASYDYAYYDSDPGFTEYDHVEEFVRTKKRA